MALAKPVRQPKLNIEGKFVQVPLEILKTLTPSELYLFCVLLKFSQGKRSCWPSVGKLSQECDLTKRQVQNVLRQLEQKGVIRREIRPGRASKYHFVHDCYNPGQDPRNQFHPPLKSVSPPPLKSISPPLLIEQKYINSEVSTTETDGENGVGVNKKTFSKKQNGKERKKSPNEPSKISSDNIITFLKDQFGKKSDIKPQEGTPSPLTEDRMSFDKESPNFSQESFQRALKWFVDQGVNIESISPPGKLAVRLVRYHLPLKEALGKRDDIKNPGGWLRTALSMPWGGDIVKDYESKSQTQRKFFTFRKIIEEAGGCSQLAWKKNTSQNYIRKIQFQKGKIHLELDYYHPGAGGYSLVKIQGLSVEKFKKNLVFRRTGESLYQAVNK